MSSTRASTGTLVAAGSALLVAAALSRKLFFSGGLATSDKSKSLSDAGTVATTDIDDEEEWITPEDVVKIFDTLFLHMQSVVAQLSAQIQQIQAAGQVIPEAQLRQLLRSEFENALRRRQGRVFEDNDVDEDCLREATFEFLASPDEYPKVRRSVERFQKLYENVTGESVVTPPAPAADRSATASKVSDSAANKSTSPSKDLTQEELLSAATTYFEALTEAMRGVVKKFREEEPTANFQNPAVARRLHLEFASVANEAGEAALGKIGVTHDGFRAAVERYSSSPEVGRTLAMLQMQQQQELMAMGIPAM